jgi:exonuclease SbcC
LAATAAIAHGEEAETFKAADHVIVDLQAQQTAGKKAQAQAVEGLADANQAYANEVDRLPEDLRPQGADIRVETARLGDRLNERAAILAERAAARIHWQKEIDDLLARRDDTEAGRQAAVGSPADRLWTEIVAHHATLGPASNALEFTFSSEPLPARPPVAELPDLVRCIESVTEQARSALDAATTDLQTEQDTAAETVSAVGQELEMAAAGFDVVLEATSRLLQDAAFEHRQAAAAAAAFAGRMPVVAELRAVGLELEERYLALADLAAALKDGAFPKWLTLRRSRLLLVHASRLLSEMSAQRYAFADLDDDAGQWSVFDSDNGQPRSPASLSGGEKFVASLALALGMVEMMGRQGGRIESLFLDEGFGALDRTNLDAAVEALASVAAKGRMVAVITHLRAVAEQIDNVLSVTREPAGSEAVWLTSEARADLAQSSLETASGLLE